jgi:hypothetical protein
MPSFCKQYLDTLSPQFNYEPVQSLTETFPIRKQIITNESDNLLNKFVTFN